jgi:hypothetical protein
MKVLFLDYDGVLNRFDQSSRYATPVVMKGEILTQAEPELVYRLNLVVDRTDAEIVLSSSWRHQPDWREALAASGVVKPLLDRTPRYSDHHKYGIAHDQLCRGHNIQDWLDAHPDVERYAILDDSSDMLASQLLNFFRTDTATGLTQEIADAIERHLAA